MTPEALVFNAIQSALAGRVYPEQAPADVGVPYAVVQVINSERSYTLSSVVRGSRPLLQIDVYDSAAKPLSEFINMVSGLRSSLERAGLRVRSEGREREADTNLRRARLDMTTWLNQKDE